MIDLDAATAEIHAEDAERELLEHDKGRVSLSDAIACVRAKWIAMHCPDVIAPFTDDDRWMFGYGHWAQARTHQIIVRALGPAWTVRNEVTVELDGTPGHADHVCEHPELPPIVMDTKTKGGRSVSCNEHYCITTSLYAAAVGAPRFGIHVVSRVNGEHRAYWFATEDFAPEARASLAYVKAMVQKESMPPAEPHPATEIWACAYCRVPPSACSSNRNPLLRGR